MNIHKLKELCNKHTVTVSFNGFLTHKQEVIDAVNLLEEIHLASDLPKEEFIANINSGNFMCEELKSFFLNIQTQGTFHILGYDALNGHEYIERRKLTWL